MGDVGRLGVAADEIVRAIDAGTAKWADLFGKSDFFYRYKTYLQVVVTAATSEALSSWYAVHVLVGP